MRLKFKFRSTNRFEPSYFLFEIYQICTWKKAELRIESYLIFSSTFGDLRFDSHWFLTSNFSKLLPYSSILPIKSLPTWIVYIKKFQNTILILSWGSLGTTLPKSFPSVIIITCRIGAIGSYRYPSIFYIYSWWLTDFEKSFFASSGI